jgi:hypothetical protein
LTGRARRCYFVAVSDRPLRFSFRERMVGPLARGLDNPRVGAERGRADNTWMTADLVATIDDLGACIAGPTHVAALAGRVSFDPIAADAEVRDGTLELYAGDPATGMKQIRYRFAFVGGDGHRYSVQATKFIRPGRATIREQVTAYARVFAAAPAPAAAGAAATPTIADVATTASPRDAAGDAAPTDEVVAAGILVFRVRDLPSFLWSMRVEGASRLAGLRHFLAFSRREISTPVPALAS